MRNEDKKRMIKQYEELISMMGIENDEDEKEMIDKWIARSGLEKVYQECYQIYHEENEEKKK